MALGVGKRESAATEKGQVLGSVFPGRERRQNQLYEGLFLLILLACVLFVLWLPVFPTGDGPVHLYYAGVLWGLVRHQPAYAQDYAIRHLFAPYLVHYLALVSFEHFVRPPVAEKIFIAIILLTQAFGFRFLARRLGREAPVVCLWMLPLLFSWSLGGGFLNCCFATGVALWSFGLWTSLGPAGNHAPRPGWRGSAGLLLAYAGLLAVLVLSHPVPLLVLLLFTASDLLLRVAGRWLWPAHPALLLPQVAALALTAAAFIVPVLLAQKGQAAAVLPEIGFHRDVLLELVAGMRLGLFAGLGIHSVSGWLAIVARIGLVAIVPGVVTLLFTGGSLTAIRLHGAQFLRQFLASPAKRLLLISLVFLATTIFFPRSLNHSYFFPQRLWDIVWLLVLACAAATPLLSPGRQWLAGGALALITLTASTGLPALTRIARAQQELAAAPLPHGRRGLFLEPDSAVDGHGAATTYPVYAWSGARAFAASHAILLNSPWLGLTILPIRDAAAPMSSEALLDRGLPSIYSESPLVLTHTLASQSPGVINSELRPGDRQAILARAEFFLYSNPASLSLPHPGTETLTAALALLGAESAAWQCEAPGFYAVCVRHSIAAH